MLKIIGFILISFILIITASLFSGFTIHSIFYKNVYIEKLYLKYDKNLTIDIDNLSFKDEKGRTQANIDTKAQINYENSHFKINIEKFLLDDTDLDVKGIVFIDTNKINLDTKSELFVENLNLQFDKQMKNVKADKVYVTMQNNQIDLKFEKPTYKDVNLDKSTVSYLIDSNILKLYLKSNTLVNKTITDAIKRYGIDIPVHQTHGENIVSTDIFIPFSKGKLFIETKLSIKDATLESYGQKFNVSTLNLHYKDLKLQGDLTLKDSNVQEFNFKDSKINYNASFEKGVDTNITSKNIILEQNENSFMFKNVSFHLKDDLIEFKSNIQDSQKHLDARVIATTNITKKSLKGDLYINNLQYEKIINQKNKNLPFSLLYKDNILFHNSTFGLSYFQNENSQNEKHKIVIRKPSKLLNSFQFIKSLDNHSSNESTGSIIITTKDFDTTNIQANNISFKIDSSVFKSDETKKNEKITLPTFPKINLSYLNSAIKYDDYKLSFDSLNLTTQANSLEATAIKKDNAKLTLKTIDNSVTFHANNVSDKYMNDIINKELFKNGSLDIHIYGEDINLLLGDVKFHQTTVKNVTVINSLLTFINTTPAIINPLLALPTLYRMAETGFDTNGYYMNHGDGSFKYNLVTKELNIYDLYTNGKMSNFIVNSNMNFDTRKIYANVDISFLKDFSKAINYIPVVGYIFLGDDGEFHTSVDITGTLDKPELETHTVKEGTRGATGVLKRIITLPLKPFQVETSPEQRKEHDKRVEEFLNPQN